MRWNAARRRLSPASSSIHGLVWTALPSLLYVNLPLDVIEAMTYGREWQLGYDKLPPLPWWLVEIMHRLFGADVAYYALAQVAVIVAFVAVLATARPLVGAAGALVAVLIIDGMHYFHYTADQVQSRRRRNCRSGRSPAYAFYAALDATRLGYWVLLGVAIGGALWAKYFMVMLAAPLCAVYDFRPRGAARIWRAGPVAGAAAWRWR